jgi:hypothetical protein
LEKNNLPDDIIFVLEYLDRYIQQWMESQDNTSTSNEEDEEDKEETVIITPISSDSVDTSSYDE